MFQGAETNADGDIQDVGSRSPRPRKPGDWDALEMCPGARGGFDTRGQRPSFGRQATCRAPLLPLWPPSPQVPTYRMKPVSVVIVSPGTTRCFLLSRPRLSLRGLRATGSLISIAILARNDLRRRSPTEGRDIRLRNSGPPRRGRGRGGASEQPPMGTHGLAAMTTIGNHWVSTRD